MTYDWNKFFEFANYLKNNNYLDTLSLDNAGKRNYISRAYYAAFNCALILGVDRGFSVTKEISERGRDHSRIRNYYQTLKTRCDSNMKWNKKSYLFNEIADELEHLHTLRKKSDYEQSIYGESPFNVDDKLQEAIDYAENIMSNLNEIYTRKIRP